MWELYNELIDGISDDATADAIICGASHALVRCGDGVGLSGTLDETWRSPTLKKREVGMNLRELAQCVRSWDYSEAIIGQAAINAWYNEKSRLRALGLQISDTKFVEDRTADPFIASQREVKGKKVTIIGHFPYIDQLLAPVCDLSIIERFYPKDGDYPEQAADFLLPVSDYVFISSYTFGEKTLPRYLSLSKNAVVTIVGPSCPVTPILGKYGVNQIAGFSVRDNDAAEQIVLGLGGNIHTTGQKVNYTVDS
jgi:uncharacterized protein (DUF4213/DUF364 family)